MGIIITAAACALALPATHILPHRVTHQQFLQGSLADVVTRRGETEDSRAQPADWPGGDLEHADAVARPTRHSAWTGPCANPRAGVEDCANPQGRLRRRVELRRGRVDGLLEEGPVKWIGLVEDRQRLQPPAREDAFESELAPRR